MRHPELSFVSVERKLNSKIFKVDVTFLFVRDRVCVFGQNKVTSKEAQARPDGEIFLLAIIVPRCPMQLVLDRTRIRHADSTRSIELSPWTSAHILVLWSSCCFLI